MITSNYYYTCHIVNWAGYALREALENKNIETSWQNGWDGTSKFSREGYESASTMRSRASMSGKRSFLIIS